MLCGRALAMVWVAADPKRANALLASECDNSEVVVEAADDKEFGNMRFSGTAVSG
jgi:siroheme synthase (precorrin-2 oxidase/ferrochelatase)